MAKIISNCVNNIFIDYDYNNSKINMNTLLNHDNNDNAWIAIDKNIYSISKNDDSLLKIFKHYYGKDVKKYLLNNEIFSNRSRIIILEKLKNRKIGYLI